MAEPIPLELPASDPRAELQARLQRAPLEHAEALLSAYEVLQGLHDRGVFDMMRGALGSSDKLIEIIVEASKSPESIRGLRNLIIMARIFGSIEPEVFEGFACALPEAIAFTQEHGENPPSIWSLWKMFRKKDVRRGLLLLTSMLEALGKNLPSKNPTETKAVK